MRSDFENVRLEFPVSVRLFRMLDRFFEFRPAFPIAGQLLPKRSGNRNFRPTLSKAVGHAPRNRSSIGFTVILQNHADTWQFRPSTSAGVFMLDDHGGDARH